MIHYSPAKFQAFILALICCSGFSFLMPFRIYLVCFFLVFSIFINLSGTKIKVMKQPLTYILLLFLFVMIIGIGESYDRGETIKYVITFLAGASLIVLKNSDEFYQLSLQYIKVGCKFVAISIGIQIVIPNIYRDYLYFFIQGGASAIPRLNKELTQHIYSGIVGEKGEAAFLMVMAIVLLLSECAYKRRFTRKEFIWLILYLVALLLPAKRMLFAVGILLIMLYIIFWTNGSKKVVALGACGFLGTIGYGVMLIVPSLNTLLNRFTSFAGDDTANGRIYLWEHAFRMFEQKPWFGYGYGSYNAFASDRGVILTQSRIWESHAHCIYFQMLGEIGIVGLLLFLILNIIAITMAIHLYKRREYLNFNNFRYLFVGINIVILVLVYGFTGNIIYYTNQIMIYMWGLGLLAFSYRYSMIGNIKINKEK